MSPPQWSVREVRGVMQRAAREYGEDIYRVIVDLLLHGNVPLLFAFLHYVDGKPVERIKVTSSPDFSELPYDELAARVETMLQRLRPRQLQSVVDVETDDGKTVEQLQHEAAEAQREAEQAQREAEAARLHCLRLQAKEQR